MKLFRILFGIDAAGLLVLLFFFIEGQRGTYAYGQGPSLLWILALAIPGGTLVWAWSQMKQGKVSAANKALGVLAVPCVFGLLIVGWASFFPLRIQ